MLYLVGDYQNILNKLIGSKTVVSWPVFPLNTDGIDPAGSNVTIRNVNITNFDDSIAVKPTHNYATVAKDGCTQDVIV
jgi:polygalacturonase